MSPNRYAALTGYSNEPTTTVDGQAITRGGTLTLAATDGGTGVVDNGPSTGTTLQLGLDNTATSGAIVYQINPAAATTGANFANFGGLVLKKTGAGTVVTNLMANTTLNGTSPASTTLTMLGGTLDVNDKTLTVGSAALVTGAITNGAAVSGGTVSTGAITKTTGSNFTVGPKVRMMATSLNVNGGTLTVTTNGSAASTSRVNAITIAGTAALNLTDNDLIVRNGTSTAQVRTYLATGYAGGNQDGVGGIHTSAGAANGSTTLGYLTGDEYNNVGGTGTFDGLSYTATDTLIKYTYYGDVDFSGSIDITDYILIDQGFQNGSTGWANGDVDFSGGAPDIVDYILTDQAFQNQGGTVLRAIAYLDGTDKSNNGMADPSLQKIVEHVNEFGPGYASAMLAALPEPTSLGIVGLAAGALMGRRRRRAAK